MQRSFCKGLYHGEFGCVANGSETKYNLSKLFTMKIEKELYEIRQIYAEANTAEKQILEKLYSKSVLGDIKNKIKSFEDACEYLSLPISAARQNFSTMPSDEKAFYQLEIICKALNEGWTPDWSDDDQPKYYPWFDFQGGRFVFLSVDYSYASSCLGSRLCFRTHELAEYAGKTFINLYNDFLK